MFIGLIFESNTKDNQPNVDSLANDTDDAGISMQKLRNYSHSSTTPLIDANKQTFKDAKCICFPIKNNSEQSNSDNSVMKKLKSAVKNYINFIFAIYGFFLVFILYGFYGLWFNN